MTGSVVPRAPRRAVDDPVRRTSKVALRLLVLVSGMTTMATEMSASRLLAPFFGTSILVWANVIGLILVYLSIGYWIGGRIADRHPNMLALCRVTLCAAITIALIPFVAHPVLAAATEGISTSSIGVVIGSFAGTLLLFSVPVTLLGMVPPFAIRLAIDDVGSAGSAAGGLYALSTIGSIVGTFGSVLLMIPIVGTRRTMLAFALLLAALSVAWVGRRAFAVGPMLLIAIGLLLPAGAVKDASAGQRVVFERESPYQFVQVVEDVGSGVRELQLNEAWAVHSVYDPSTALVGGVWDRFLTLPLLARRGARSRMLLIGSAAGTIPREYRRVWPGIAIDGVEIDPDVIAAGRSLFDMDGPNLTVHRADGRPFLASTDRRWDIILIDAYRQPYIPFYLTTREFFALVERHLAAGGVVAINVGAAPGDERIQRAIGATMRDVLPAVFRYRAQEFNEILLATRAPAWRWSIQRRLRTRSAPRPVRGFASDMAARVRAVRPDRARVLTDDRAPVEWMTDGMILRYARRSGR